MKTCNGPFHVTNGNIGKPDSSEDDGGVEWLKKTDLQVREGTHFRVTCGRGYKVESNGQNEIDGTITCDDNNSWQNMPKCASKIFIFF